MIFVQETTDGTAICNKYTRIWYKNCKGGGVNVPNKSIPVDKNSSLGLIPIEFNTHKIQWVHNYMEEAPAFVILK